MVDGKVVIVTGGAGRIGSAMCSAIIENGGMAVVADINLELAKQVCAQIASGEQAGQVLPLQLDITSKASINEAVAAVVERFGKVDALVNNALPINKNFGRHFFDVTYEDFNDNVSRHVGGYFLASQQLALFFKEQGHGNIINIGSIYGVCAPRFDVYEGTPMTSAVEYAAIKSAVIHLTKYMAKYLKGENIRVNALSPGGILDNQPEPFLEGYKRYCSTKGMLDAADLQGALLFLLSDGSRYVNGQNIVVDDGFTL